MAGVGIGCRRRKGDKVEEGRAPGPWRYCKGRKKHWWQQAPFAVGRGAVACYASCSPSSCACLQAGPRSKSGWSGVCMGSGVAQQGSR